MKRETIFVFLVAAATIPVQLLAHEGHERKVMGTVAPVEVVAAYLDAMESGDLDAAEALFASRSSIFESGGEEGTWQSYREHHIGPELAEFEAFTITRGEPETQSSQDSSMAFVAWPIEYRIQLRDERTIESRGTVTFVMVLEGPEWRIRHLHWSSRRKPAAD